jgi:hypothetical protein
VLDHILRLLESPNPGARRWACKLTGNLAFHEFTAPAILKPNLSVQLVSLLGWACIFFLLQHHLHELFVSETYWATYTLSRIARWVDGTKSVVDAKALDHILRLLELPNPGTRRWACKLMGHLALHESTAPAILQLNIPARLVSLLAWVCILFSLMQSS